MNPGKEARVAWPIGVTVQSKLEVEGREALPTGVADIVGAPDIDLATHGADPSRAIALEFEEALPAFRTGECAAQEAAFVKHYRLHDRPARLTGPVRDVPLEQVRNRRFRVCSVGLLEDLQQVPQDALASSLDNRLDLRRQRRARGPRTAELARWNCGRVGLASPSATGPWSRGRALLRRLRGRFGDAITDLAVQGYNHGLRPPGRRGLRYHRLPHRRPQPCWFEEEISNIYSPTLRISTHAPVFLGPQGLSDSMSGHDQAP